MNDIVNDKFITTVTADDVAKLAGVSRWTVTRAFKKDASISKKSRGKVMQAAAQLGYAPDLMAAGLASNRSNLVALLIDDFANPHKLVMLESLTRILRKNGWDILLVNTLSEEDAPIALLNASQRRVDAAVFIGSKFNDLAFEAAMGSRSIRQLIVFARFSENLNAISICCDDEKAMANMAQYVIQKGYKRPVFLAGPQTPSAHLKRKETFLAKWAQIKGVEPDFTVVDVYDPQLAFTHVANYVTNLDPTVRPDILVCENDALAMGAIDAIRYELGLRVPEDIAVTGFDDVPQAQSPHYLLTTYRQPISAMAEALVQVLEGTHAGIDLTGFTGQLLIRDSA